MLTTVNARPLFGANSDRRNQYPCTGRFLQVRSAALAPVRRGKHERAPGMSLPSKRARKDRHPTSPPSNSLSKDLIREAIRTRNGDIGPYHGYCDSENDSPNKETLPGCPLPEKTLKRQISDSAVRKLILHFDIRNTVLVADSVTNVSVEQALNSFLTGVTWGSVDRDTKQWRWHSNTPSLSPPAPGTITYYKHLEQKLVKSPEDRTNLRLMTGDFTQRRIGAMFHPYFERLMEMMRWPHAAEGESAAKLTMKGKDDTLYHYILPSFFRLLFHLHKTKRDFAIVFRTFGLDSANVLMSTELAINGGHPQFPESFVMDVNRVPGCVKRVSGEAISLEMESCKNGLSVPKVFKNEREIYETLSQTRGVCAFKDDFRYWQSNGYHYTAGKPLWMDPSDDKVHHIIFDDNMRTYEDDSIVDLRRLDGDKATSLTKAELAQYEDVFMVQADLASSIQNQDYFIDKLKLCEENFEKMLAKDRFKNADFT